MSLEKQLDSTLANIRHALKSRLIDDGQVHVCTVMFELTSDAERRFDWQRTLRTFISTSSINETSFLRFHCGLAVFFHADEISFVHDLIENCRSHVFQNNAGAIKSETFKPPINIGALSHHIQKHLSQFSKSVQAPESSSKKRKLEQLVGMEKMLSQADLSNLVRERPVYKLPNDFASDPVCIQTELVTDLKALSATAGLDLRGDGWLCDQVTRLLDLRMMSHILVEPSHRANNFCINLHIDTVLSSQFDDFHLNLSSLTQPTYSVDLNVVEASFERSDFYSACRKLSGMGVLINIDGVAPDHVDEWVRDEAITGQIKVDWRQMDGNSFKDDSGNIDWSSVSDRLVLLQCVDRSILRAGAKTGLKLFEGFEVPGLLEKQTPPKPVEHYPGIERVIGGAPPPKKSFFSKVLRR